MGGATKIPNTGVMLRLLEVIKISDIEPENGQFHLRWVDDHRCDVETFRGG